MTRNLSIYFLNEIEPVVLWSIIGGVIALLVVIGIFVAVKRKKKSIKKPLDAISGTYIQNLCNALGGKDNIEKISLEHKRLKVQLVQIKKVNQNELKTLEISGFLVGKELKLLIKDGAAKVFELLKKEVENNNET